MIDVYMERLDHPYLFALVPVAAVLFGLSVVAHLFSADTWAGFLVLYSVVMLILCGIGYGTMFSFAYSTEALRQWRVKRRST